MMHHPNMHHQAMSGHPPQHMAGHQGLPAHHQIPPHQMHRENRHVTLTRVPLGPSGGAHTHGHAHAHGHGQALGALGGVPVHHAPAPAPRPPHHAARPLHHAPQHHAPLPPPLKQLRRGYGAGGAFGPGAGALPPPYAPQPRAPPPLHPHPGAKMNGDVYAVAPTPAGEAGAGGAGVGVAGAAGVGAEGGAGEGGAGAGAAPGDSEAARPAPANPANSKEKTPMCLVNELARYNKIKHQYRLTSETGPAHKKVFTVTLRLGDTEEYTAEGSSIKRAQHAAASAALSATAFPPPPPRAPAPHQPAHAHHRHSVMPTVELNALAMKLCEPAVYTSVPAVATRGGRGRVAPMHRPGLGAGVGGGLLYRVRVAVGGRAWLGDGATPQAARHDAAARALRDLRTANAAPATPDCDATGEGATAVAGEAPGAEVKSPVSLVHELALKRSLSVLFTVKSERGPPHMRVFVTACTVGELETEGEGNGKKVSKRRAAERMLEEMRRRWPAALMRARPAHERRRPPPAKKKPRNLVKEGGAGAAAGAGGDNPISRLAVARHAARARSPQYRVLEERGCARRREFLVQCDAPPHRATGAGPNKKAAKRRAAHNVLLAMELNPNGAAEGSADAGGGDAAAPVGADTKRKELEGAAGAEGRQPVPGVLLMDYHQRGGQPPPPNGVSETSATGSAGGGAGGGGSSPGAKDQLLYLAQLLGFTVQFSDFPKRNHGEYLSLVSLSTEPPVMCHGGGASTAHSHEQCARAALRALALMGLDAPAPAPPPAPHTLPSGAGVVGPGAPE